MLALILPGGGNVFKEKRHLLGELESGPPAELCESLPVSREDEAGDFARRVSQGSDRVKTRVKQGRAIPRGSGITRPPFYGECNTIKKAGQDIPPFRRNGMAVLHSENKRLNLAELCEKLSCLPANGPIIHNYSIRTEIFKVVPRVPPQRFLYFTAGERDLTRHPASF